MKNLHHKCNSQFQVLDKRNRSPFFGQYFSLKHQKMDLCPLFFDWRSLEKISIYQLFRKKHRSTIIVKENSKENFKSLA